MPYYKNYKIPSYSDRNITLEPKVREEYRNIDDPYRQAVQVALDHSNNGKCWWVYQHIVNCLTHR